MKKAYPKYREIDLPWLSAVPANWDIKRAKYVFQAIDERSDSGEETLLSVSEHYGVIPRDQANVTMFQAESYVGYKLCSSKDLVINSLWAWSRGLGFSEYRGIISTAYDVFRLRQIDKYDHKYFNYLLRTNAYVGEYVCRSKGIWISRLQLSTGAFLEIPILLPSIEEQHQIASFLDHKCALIDTFIQKKTRLIELLKEQKQAIINKAVTRGIDLNVRLKPSGIDWLGDIPEHWEVKRLKYLGKIRYGLGQPPAEIPNGKPLIRATNVKSGKILTENMLYVDDEELSSGKDVVLSEGDIIVVRSGAYTADSSIIPKEFHGAIAGYDMSFRPTRIESSFMGFCLLSHYLKVYQLLPESMRSAQPHLNSEELGNAFVLVPPRQEQRRIVTYIDFESEKIDNATIKIKREIDLIQEYKTTLIAEAVTGKIDVRDWKPNREEIDAGKSRLADPV